MSVIVMAQNDQGTRWWETFKDLSLAVEWIAKQNIVYSDPTVFSLVEGNVKQININVKGEEN